ncbi:hypothetical protein EAO69_43925 [Streptomyces sp. me109]|nr:hypothetical protein EAO69_43925 [Streptomyces sp. me109]
MTGDRRQEERDTPAADGGAGHDGHDGAGGPAVLTDADRDGVRDTGLGQVGARRKAVRTPATASAGRSVGRRKTSGKEC